MTTFRHASLFKEKLESLTLAPKFRQIALTFAEAPYGWGKESLTTSDCSGLFSGTLQYLGYNIRTTADRFFKKAFGDTTFTFKPDEINAIFFINDDGAAKHMGLFVSETVVFHASGARGLTFDDVHDLIEEYANKGYEAVIQVLNWDLLEDLDGECSGLDDEYL